MSIQRYHFYNIYGTPIPDNKVMDENGDYVLFTDHVSEIERHANENTDLGMQIYKLKVDRDAAVRERDAAVEALTTISKKTWCYISASSTCETIVVIARAALAEMEQKS